MKINIKNNSNILNIMFTVYYNLLIEMFEFIFGFYDVIKDKIVLLMLNENIQDYLWHPEMVYILIRQNQNQHSRIRNYHHHSSMDVMN